MANGIRYFALISFLIAIASVHSFGKGPTTRITIESPRFAKPIEITDPAITHNFQVFGSLIVDWASGAVTAPSGLETYRVSFHVGEYPHPYIVQYASDPSDKQGYVYLPGKSDEWYSTNVSMIIRGVEGHWFRASAGWEDVARPLIEKQQRFTQ